MLSRLGSKLGTGLFATVLAVMPFAAPARAAAPTAITFRILHADCGGIGSSAFSLFLNGVSLGSFRSTQACTCNTVPLEVTFTDATTLALFDPTICNDARVD